MAMPENHSINSEHSRVLHEKTAQKIENKTLTFLVKEGCYEYLSLT